MADSSDLSRQLMLHLLVLAQGHDSPHLLLAQVELPQNHQMIGCLYLSLQDRKDSGHSALFHLKKGTTMCVGVSEDRLEEQLGPTSSHQLGTEITLHLNFYSVVSCLVLVD